MKGHDISINGLTKSNDGKGNEILVDDKSTGAQISIEGSTLRLADISDAYKDDVAFEKQNVDIIVKRTDGTDQVFKSGYKTDGVYLYDTNGHKLTLSQEIDEAQIVNGLTGQNYHRIGACDATSDSKLIGQVCAFELDANGNEVQKDRISGQNFTREDLTVSGNVNNADMRKANEAKEANSTGWADVDRNTITSKVVDTVKGQARVLDQALDVPKPVSITGISENRLFGGYRDYETLPPMTVTNADGTTSEIKTSRDLENAINRLYSKGESVTVNIGGKAMTLNKKDPKYAEDIQMVNDYYNEMKIRANDKTEHNNSNVAGSVTGTLTKAGAGVPASATSDKGTAQVMGDSGATYVGKQDSTEQADKPANEGQSADVEYVEATGTGDSNRAATTNAQINLAKKAGVEHVKAEVVDKGKNQDGSYFVTMRMAVPKK